MRSVVQYGFLFFIAFCFAGAVGYLSISVFTKSAEELVIPEFKGKNILFVLETLTHLGLNPKLHGTQYDDTIPKYGVTFQDPPAGATIKKGRDVVITISKGPRQAVVPDLRQVPFGEALIVLEKNEFTQGTLSHVHSSDTPKDHIIAQYPPALSTVESNFPCSFLISKGPKPLAQVMPDLKGLALNAAVTRLEDQDLQVLKIHSKNIPQLDQGLVLSQTPEFGSQVSAQTPIELIANGTTEGLVMEPVDFKGVILVTYPLSLGFLKKHVRVESDILGVPLDLCNDYFPPGKDIHLLIPAGIKTKIKIFVDHELVKTSIIDPWNRDNDTGELLWE
ncbi:MAG: PASTA domain-containing protein [Proteobacteria bacterium]|nr:PASTA domain-containing protein [Pseudomonadota bacterium]